MLSPRYFSYGSKKKYLKKINKFYKYDDTILQSMQNKTIYEHKYIDGVEKIDKNMRKKLYDLTDITATFLEKHNIVYWLDSGTLLGAVRNRQMIEWDDDVDLAIPYESYIKLEELIKTFYHEKIDTDTFYFDYEHKIKFKILQGEPKNVLFNNITFIIKTYFLDDDSVFVDLLVYVKKKNRYISNYIGWENIFYYDVNDIYPLKKIKFGNRKYYTVRNPVNFLNNAYKFWRHLGVASHAHYKHLKKTRSRNNYFLL